MCVCVFFFASLSFWTLQRTFGVSGLCRGSGLLQIYQDHRERGVEFKGVAIMTETAMTAETAAVASFCCNL